MTKTKTKPVEETSTQTNISRFSKFGYYHDLLDNAMKYRSVNRFEPSSILVIATVLGEVACLPEEETRLGDYLVSDYKVADEFKQLVLAGSIKFEVGFKYNDLRDLDWNKAFFSTGGKLPTPAEFKEAQDLFLNAFKKSASNFSVMDTGATTSLASIKCFVDRDASLATDEETLVPIYVPQQIGMMKKSAFMYDIHDLVIESGRKFGSALK